MAGDRGAAVQQREQYLTQAWQYYGRSTPEQRLLVQQSLERMTPHQREVFAEAVGGVIKARVLQGAKTYQSMKSPGQQAQFAQQFYGNFKQMQRDLVGGGSTAPGMDVTGPLRAAAPSNPQEIHKAIVNNSTPSERATAEPFIDKLAEVHRTEIQKKVNGG